MCGISIQCFLTIEKGTPIVVRAEDDAPNDEEQRRDH